MDGKASQAQTRIWPPYLIHLIREAAAGTGTERGSDSPGGWESTLVHHGSIVERKKPETSQETTVSPS